MVVPVSWSIGRTLAQDRQTKGTAKAKRLDAGGQGGGGGGGGGRWVGGTLEK